MELVASPLKCERHAMRNEIHLDHLIDQIANLVKRLPRMRTGQPLRASWT
jgi:hypothetical protein